jgi:hypothetical protein
MRQRRRRLTVDEKRARATLLCELLSTKLVCFSTNKRYPMREFGVWLPDQKRYFILSKGTPHGAIVGLPQSRRSDERCEV